MHRMCVFQPYGFCVCMCMTLSSVILAAITYQKIWACGPVGAVTQSGASISLKMGRYCRGRHVPFCYFQFQVCVWHPVVFSELKGTSLLLELFQVNKTWWMFFETYDWLSQILLSNSFSCYSSPCHIYIYDRENSSKTTMHVLSLELKLQWNPRLQKW